MKNRGLSILLRILSGSNVAEENIRFAIEIVMNPYYRFYRIDLHKEDSKRCR